MEEPGGGEDKVALLVSARVPLFAFEVPCVDWEDSGVIFGGVVDVFWAAEGRVWVEEVVGARCEGNPFPVWC